MNVVFVCGGYYPNNSATGNCVKKIADRFTKDGYRVMVVCKRATEKDSIEEQNGQKIIRVTNQRLLDAEKYGSYSANGTEHKKLQQFCYKVKWALYGLTRKDGLDTPLVKAYLTALRTLSEKNKIDILIPCCMPAECLYAAYLFVRESKQKTGLFPLLYDLYSENINFFRYRWNHALRKPHAERNEEEIFAASRVVFYVDNWKEHFAKRPIGNAVRVEHPLVDCREEQPVPLPKSTHVNAVYQGEINCQMRPPTAMLKAFTALCGFNSEISLHVFAYGNSVSEVEQAVNACPNNIVFYGRVNKVAADGYFDAADVAVILANRDKRLVPSKIFECVSSGKPIVYFYYTKEENSYQLLEKYPLIFFIQQDDTSVVAYQQLSTWIGENYQKRVPYAVIRQLYDDATPDYVVEEIQHQMMEKGKG